MNYVRQYLRAYKNAWSPTTYKSEKYRMKSLEPYLHLVERPDKLYKAISPLMKPYSVLTAFTRLSSYLDFLIEEGLVTGPNKIKLFKKRNKNLFKNAYVTEKLTLTFEEAEAKINTLANPSLRDDCLLMLYTGVRIHETELVIVGNQGNKVLGKGGKIRPFLSKRTFKHSALEIRQGLSHLGIKPHSLRKLFATRLVERGISPQDLCEIMGWSDIKTAYRYLQPKTENKLQAIVNEAVNGN